MPLKFNRESKETVASTITSYHYSLYLFNILNHDIFKHAILSYKYYAYAEELKKNIKKNARVKNLQKENLYHNKFLTLIFQVYPTAINDCDV